MDCRVAGKYSSYLAFILVVKYNFKHAFYILIHETNTSYREHRMYWDLDS